MVVAYSDNLMYNVLVDSLTERKGGFRPPCHHNIVRMNTTEVFMAKRIDLTGQKFGRLTVIKDTGKKNNDKRALWLCKCNCGNEVIISGKDLRNGNTQSCGCLQRDRSRKHGEWGTRLYRIWYDMKDRCFNKNSVNYKYYGGRGITICKEWKEKPFLFFQWARNNGYQDNLTIDRIDSNGNYEPSNCRWATMKEQSNNVRNNKRITYNNETHTMSEWAEILNIDYHLLQSRLYHKWSFERAIKSPKLKNQYDRIRADFLPINEEV